MQRHRYLWIDLLPIDEQRRGRHIYTHGSGMGVMPIAAQDSMYVLRASE